MKVKVQAVRREKRPETVFYDGDYIKLESALKLSGAAETGGAAKLAIQAGEAAVNGEICTQRGKKLRDGDTVAFRGAVYAICRHEAE